MKPKSKPKPAWYEFQFSHSTAELGRCRQSQCLASSIPLMADLGHKTLRVTNWRSPKQNWKIQDKKQMLGSYKFWIESFSVTNLKREKGFRKVGISPLRGAIRLPTITDFKNGVVKNAPPSHHTVLAQGQPCKGMLPRSLCNIDNTVSHVACIQFRHCFPIELFSVYCMPSANPGSWDADIKRQFLPPTLNLSQELWLMPVIPVLRSLR